MAMRAHSLHSWDLCPKRAIEIQRLMALRVTQGPAMRRFSLVAAADVSYERSNRKMYGVVVVCKYPHCQIVEHTTAIEEERFPYVPGLLSFRESPVLLKAFEGLDRVPDVILFDGQGIAHPRRLGIASHVGLVLGCPTIGCAKSRLVGQYREPGKTKNCQTRLQDGSETIGKVLRTRNGKKPIFVSIGHGIDLESAVRVTRKCVTRYRLPDPIRMAHQLANRLRKEDQTTS